MSRGIVCKLSVLGMVCVLLFSVRPVFSQESRDKRIDELEKEVRELRSLVKSLQKDMSESSENYKGRTDVILEEIDALKQGGGAGSAGPNWTNKLTLGGYGEFHMNRNDGADNDFADAHRVVMYLGYDFTDWLQLSSELEVEHAFVNDGDGELVFEQLYADIKLSDYFENNGLNFRVGRVLTPLGLVNRIHEPTTFHGVERPTFNSVIIPSTWSTDGFGIFGDLGSQFKYELYAGNGLDASGFNSTNGIRGGRLKERPGLKNLSVTGRLDWFALQDNEGKWPQSLRLGGAFYTGNAENSDQGATPNADEDPAVSIGALDAQYSIGRFDFRGELAQINISDADDLGGGVAEEIFGWYLEGAYHLMPDVWKKGMWKDSDLVIFTRYEDLDTQHEMPTGILANDAGDRNELTVGATFFLTQNFVLKADYQFKEDERDGDQARNAFNLGIGWDF